MASPVSPDSSTAAARGGTAPVDPGASVPNAASAVATFVGESLRADR
jgi:hypothetical protein